MAKVSVIIPVYNASAYLRRSLSSLRAQTFGDFEVILVNDCSTDDSRDICEETCLADGRFRLVDAPRNQGAGLARNLGLEAATGEYLGFMDSDDCWAPNAIELRYGAAKKFDLDMVKGDMERFSDDASLENIFRSIPLGTDLSGIHILDSEEEIRRLALRMTTNPPGVPLHPFKFRYVMGTSLFRRSLVEDNHIRYLSEREVLTEDTLWVFRVMQHVKRFGALPQTTYYYRHTPQSISTSPRDHIIDGVVRYAEVAGKYAEEFGYGKMGEIGVMGSCVNLLRGAMQVAFKNYGKEKALEWLDYNSRHPYVGKLYREYPWRKLPFRHMAIFYAFATHNYALSRLLFNGREAVKKVLKI